MATENGMWSFAPIAPFKTMGIATQDVPTTICNHQLSASITLNSLNPR